MKTSKDITMDIMKDNSRVVDFTKMITEQEEFVRKARHMAGDNPNKVEKAYIEEQETKLKEVQHIVRRWIWEAWTGDNDIAKKTNHWHNIEENFQITVLVEKKKT
jgi:hypothetical protein